MNLSTWIKVRVFRMNVPEKKLPPEVVLLNGALHDLTASVDEMNRRLASEKVFDDALAAMNKEYRK